MKGSVNCYIATSTLIASSLRYYKDFEPPESNGVETAVVRETTASMPKLIVLDKLNPEKACTRQEENFPSIDELI